MGHDTQDEIPFVSLSKDEYETDDVRIAMIGERELREEAHTVYRHVICSLWYRGGMRSDSSFICRVSCGTKHILVCGCWCAGNVDSGKSTLMGVLTNATLDDGRGSARALVRTPPFFTSTA